MNAVDKGRFCVSCQKTVFDFSNASDVEILSKFKNSEKDADGVCGRFKKSQLDRELTRPSEKLVVVPYLASGILGVLSVASAQGQQNGKPEIAVVASDSLRKMTSENDSFETGKFAIAELFAIKGNISYENIPLPGASVLKNNQRVATADVDGNFELQALAGDVLTFSFVGMTDQKLIVGQVPNYNVKLEESGELMGDVVVMKRPNAFKRSYRRIRNWFR